MSVSHRGILIGALMTTSCHYHLDRFASVLIVFLVYRFKFLSFMSKKSRFAIFCSGCVWDLRVSMKRSSKTKERPVDPSSEDNKVSFISLLKNSYSYNFLGYMDTS